MLELQAAPLRQFSVTCPNYYSDLAQDLRSSSLVELPPFSASYFDAFANYCQTVHGKKIPQGYVGSFAVTFEHNVEASRWYAAYLLLRQGEGHLIEEMTRERGIDLVTLRKTLPQFREPLDVPGIVWAPFARVSGVLVEIRQRGPVAFAWSREPAAVHNTLSAVYGPPVFEDKWIAVFRTAHDSAGK